MTLVFLLRQINPVAWKGERNECTQDEGFNRIQQGYEYLNDNHINEITSVLR